MLGCLLMFFRLCNRKYEHSVTVILNVGVRIKLYLFIVIAKVSTDESCISGSFCKMASGLFLCVSVLLTFIIWLCEPKNFLKQKLFCKSYLSALGNVRPKRHALNASEPWISLIIRSIRSGQMSNQCIPSFNHKHSSWYPTTRRTETHYSIWWRWLVLTKTTTDVNPPTAKFMIRSCEGKKSLKNISTHLNGWLTQYDCWNITPTPNKNKSKSTTNQLVLSIAWI